MKIAIRIQGIILIIIFLVLFMTLSVNADSSVFTIDTVTHGDWVGVYGSDGYFLAGETEAGCSNFLPENIKMNFSDIYGGGINYWLWYDSNEEHTYSEEKLACSPYALFSDQTKTARKAACVFNNIAVDIFFNLGDTPRYVTVYTGDFDNPYNASEARVMLVSLYDENFNTICDYELKDSSKGCYFTFLASGNVIFEVLTLSGANSVIHGVFFDTELSEKALNARSEIFTSTNITEDNAKTDSDVNDLIDSEMIAPDELIITNKTKSSLIINDAFILVFVLFIVGTVSAIIFSKYPESNHL